MDNQQVGLSRPTSETKQGKVEGLMDNKYSPVCKQINLSKETIEFIVGTMFGDGHLSKISKNARIQLTHGDPQKFYIDHKADILKEICPNGVKTKLIFDKRNNKKYISHTLCSYNNRQLTELYQIFYPYKKKKITSKALDLLTDKGLAYFYMDDGGLGKYRFPNGRVAVDLYLNTYWTDEEHEIFIDFIFKKYEILFKKVKNKGKYRLRIGKKEAPKFIKIVQPYILENFKYKIDLL